MALCNKVKGSIHKKIFILISLTLIVTSIVIYAVIIYVMPKFYFYSKNKDLNKICTKFVDEIEGKSLGSTGEEFENFIKKYKGYLIEVLIFDKEGKYVQMPDNKYKNYVVSDGLDMLTEDICYEAYRYYLNKPIRVYNDKEKLRFNGNEYYVKYLMKKNTCKLKGKKYTMYFLFSIQPIEEASEVLISFIPYILFIE